MFSKAPVALRCTRMSFERASRVRGTRAPDFAIFVLLSSERACKATMKSFRHRRLVGSERTMSCQVCHAANRIALHFNIRTKHLADQRFKTTKLDNEQLVVRWKRPEGW